MPIPTDCNEGKHFINSEFCDRCDIEFDTWYKMVIEEVRKDTCIFMLSVLQAIVNEQVQARTLEKSTGSYIIDAVADQMQKKGWVK